MDRAALEYARLGRYVHPERFLFVRQAVPSTTYHFSI